MDKIDRSDLVERIYSRLDKALPRNIINDAISVIIDNMANKIKEDKSIYIHNFGTVHSYIIPSYRLPNDIITKPSVRVKFTPDENFTFLLQHRIDKFKKKD